MTGLIAEALKLQQLCEAMKWRFCFIGGLALQIWGEQRLTKDIDLTLLTDFLNDELFVNTLLSHYRGRISDAKEFALTNRVLILETADKIGIDISLGGLPFEHSLIERATYRNYTSEISLQTCSAEDLVVMKAVASRPRDWADVESIVIKQPQLDWPYIEEQVRPFAEVMNNGDVLTSLAKIRSRYPRN